MICGALQTLNEEAFEEVSSECQSSTGLLSGEMLDQVYLAPISESSELQSVCITVLKLVTTSLLTLVLTSTALSCNDLLTVSLKVKAYNYYKIFLII